MTERSAFKTPNFSIVPFVGMTVIFSVIAALGPSGWPACLFSGYAGISFMITIMTIQDKWLERKYPQ